jgi:integrase
MVRCRRARKFLPHPYLQCVPVQDCYAALLRAGLDPLTMRQAHMVLHKVLKDAMRLNLVVRSATEGAIVPKATRKEMRTLSPDQPAVLFEATRR